MHKEILLVAQKRSRLKVGTGWAEAYLWLSQHLSWRRKNSIFQVAGVLDPPPKSVLTIMQKINLCSYLPTLTYPFVLCGLASSVFLSFICPHVPFFHTTLCHISSSKVNLHSFFISKAFFFNSASVLLNFFMNWASNSNVA